MNISNKIRHIVLWAMLTIVAVAYTGKALHTHTEDYYNSFRSTRSNSTFAFYTDLLIVIEDFCTILRSNPVVNFFSLRAPPVLL